MDLFHDNLKNEYYVSIVHEVQPVQEYVDNGQYQAWDLGITKHVAVNSAGKFIEVTNARPDKYWNNKIDAMQSRRDHCKKKLRINTEPAMAPIQCCKAEDGAKTKQPDKRYSAQTE